MRRAVVFAVVLCLLAVTTAGAQAQAIRTVVAADQAQIYVFGHPIRFADLGSARGEAVVSVADSGLSTMLATLGARLDWQPGTRFVAITRADGALITFTVGSNALTVGGSSVAIATAPFYQDNQLWLPLQSLASALGLADHRFAGGHAFVPQILSFERSIGQRRTVLEIGASAPLNWRSSFGGRDGKATLTLQFPGFANAARPKLWLGGRDATVAALIESGPPGFPITTVNVTVKKGVHFSAHRMPGGAALDVIVARDPNDLRLAAVTAASALQLSPQPATRTNPPPQAQPTRVPPPLQPLPTPVPTAEPLPAGSAAGPSESPSPGESESPLPESSASESPQPESSVAPSEPPLQKISDVFVTDAQGLSRISLVVTGPVTFEWHRLGDPDNRFWVDIRPAALVGPARDLAVKLPFIKSIRVSQHELVPEHVVRVSIEPTQAIDVRIGGVQGSPNQLGLDIMSSPPDPESPTSGLGTLNVVERPPHPAIVTHAPMQPDLIVIDPGHGGNDPGAINSSVGLMESHVTLTVAQKLKSVLQHQGWRVVMTREGDYEVGDPNGDDRQELQSRCDVANAAGARLFVSVHVNSSVYADPNGVTTYYWNRSDRNFAQAVQSAEVAATDIADDGVHRGDFWVIRHTAMPAILVETAYLSNPHDAALLAQASFLDKLADGIARGIQAYTGGPPAAQ